jgi:hypothetical protein
MFVFLFVCMELIQIHISEPIWTKLRTRLPLGLEEVVGYVWTEILDVFDLFGPLSLGATAESWAQDGCRCDRFSWYPYIREFLRMFLWRHTGGALHPRHALLQQRFVRYSGTCSCDFTHTMLWHVTIAHSYCDFLALCVMHRKRGEDNNTHACKCGNLMTLGGELIMICYCIHNCTHNNNTNLYPI